MKIPDILKVYKLPVKIRSNHHSFTLKNKMKEKVRVKFKDGLTLTVNISELPKSEYKVIYDD